MDLKEGLEIALLFFGVLSLVGLTAVLFRVFKLLGPMLEMVGIYNKIKSIFGMYGQIPDIIKEKVKSFVKK